MRYGMTFTVGIYDFDREEAFEMVTRPSDYIRMKLWAGKNIDEAIDEDVRLLYTNYATVWFALEREGRLGEFGLPDGLSIDALDAMTARMSAYVNITPEDSLPLARERGR